MHGMLPLHNLADGGFAEEEDEQEMDGQWWSEQEQDWEENKDQEVDTGAAGAGGGGYLPQQKQGWLASCTGGWRLCLAGASCHNDLRS